MGTWGTAISSNDTYEDIYSEFLRLYNDGLEVPEITQRLINDNQELIADNEDKNNFWFAVAMAQWQCKSLDRDVYDKVEKIIKSGDDIKLWQEFGAVTKEINKRKKVLDSFLVKLSSEKERARKRRRKVLRDSIFQKGDCLSFKLSNGNYGGAFVLTSEKQTEYGMNLIATTTIESGVKPTITEFQKANVLVQKEQFGLGGFRDNEKITWYYAQFFKNTTIEFEVIGNLKVDKEYNFNNDYTGVSQWEMIKISVDENAEIRAERGEPDTYIELSILR